mgnify:CR=1 FL=1
MKAGKFIRKYNHIWTLLYIVFYMPWFMWLEKTVTTDFHLVSMPIDYKIPFCEYFIIPYFMWFLFVPAIVGYEFFYSKKEYYQCCAYLFSGMTIFLIVSTLWPNGQHLRPAVMPRDNIFTRMVAALYRTDTPTNLWPSIHVYNSLGAHFAIIRSKCFEKKKGIRIGSLILASSIILATMFIKQHSVFDVLTAFVMAAIMYTLVYRYDLLIAVREFRNKRKAKPQID